MKKRNKWAKDKAKKMAKSNKYLRKKKKMSKINYWIFWNFVRSEKNQTMWTKFKDDSYKNTNMLKGKTMKIRSKHSWTTYYGNIKANSYKSKF